jgi:hypothetical protein
MSLFLFSNRSKKLKELLMRILVRGLYDFFTVSVQYFGGVEFFLSTVQYFTGANFGTELVSLIPASYIVEP